MSLRSVLLSLVIGVISLATSLDRALAFGDEREFEGHPIPASSTTRHYYLTERTEAQSRVFSLFVRNKRELQDLVWERSFPKDHREEIEFWLQNVIKEYRLQLKTPNTFASAAADLTLASSWEDEISSAGVQWKANKEWSQNWELEYARWISKELHPRLMIEMQLPTDCADLAYVMRWAFARIHRLPMAVRLGGSQQLFTNETMKEEWLALPEHQDWKKDRRFRAILQYLMRNTYTHTLMKDSYPVAINTQSLTAGAHLLDLHGSSGHTMLVTSVNDPNDLPVNLLFSTVPIKIRELISTFYQDQETPKLNRNGLYKIRWAKKGANGWQFVPLASIPAYSLEQFNLGAGDADSSKPHFLRVFERLNPQFSRQLLLERSMLELRDRLQDRIKMVEDGFAFCQNNNCAPGSRGDDDWSTPSRDGRLLQLHDTINLSLDLIFAAEGAPGIEVAKNKLATFAREQSFVIDGETFSMLSVVTALVHRLTKSDPRVSIKERWGLGFDGYARNYIKAAKAMLPQRLERLKAAGQCRQQACVENASQWKALSTADLDRELQWQWIGVQRLCLLDGGSECEKLEHRLEAESLQGRTLKEWLSGISNWSSNPNHFLQERWGDAGEESSPMKQREALSAIAPRFAFD